MTSLKRKRLWCRGKEGGYQVSRSETDEHSQLSSNWQTQKRLQSPKHRLNRLKSKNNSYSLAPEETDEDTSKSQQISRAGSIDDMVFEMNGSALDTSTESLVDEGDDWSLLSADENAVRLLSSQKRGSLALNEILLGVDLDKKESDAGKEDVDPDVKDIVAVITGRYDNGSAGSETDSDSSSSTAVSEISEVEDVSSDEESEVEPHQEAFDIDAYVSNLLNSSDNDSDSDSDSDGNASDASGKAFQKAVQKVIRRIKRERSDEIVDSDEESEKSENGSETEEYSASDDDSASEASDKEDDASDTSSTKDQKEGFEMERDVIDPEIAELLRGGLVIDPKMGKHNEKNCRTVYKYYLDDNGRIRTTEKTVNNKDTSEATDDPPKNTECSPRKAKNSQTMNTLKDEDLLASTLVDDKVQDLRWPFSNFYVKEFNQDHDEVLPDKEMQTLPSYRSAAASASHPDRKMNVMLGRVWWVEWWAMEDTRMKNLSDKSFSL